MTQTFVMHVARDALFTVLILAGPAIKSRTKCLIWSPRSCVFL